MRSHFEYTDAEFVLQIERYQLDASLYSHEAHLRLAYIHIENYGLKKAIININRQLVKYVGFLGAEDKFIKTLTVAAIKAVYHFKQKSSTTNFSDFITEFPRLKYNFKDLMAVHYKIDIYNSPLAKKIFLQPDLLAFS